MFRGAAHWHSPGGEAAHEYDRAAGGTPASTYPAFTPRPLAPEEEKQRMTEALSYQQMGTAARGQAHALFAQTMGYVALTAALFTAGAWLGRDLTGAVGIVAFIAAFAV